MTSRRLELTAISRDSASNYNFRISINFVRKANVPQLLQYLEGRRNISVQTVMDQLKQENVSKLTQGKAPCAAPNVLKEEGHGAADWCLNLWVLTVDLLWEEMCIVCQHIAIVASNQDNLK